MISNNKISNLISSQVPFFVRNDHPNFVTFLEKYYEYLEQNTKAVNRAKNVLSFQNIDLTEDEFAERLYSTFMRYLPKDTATDKKVLLKHIKDFYRSRGTEQSIRFLLSAINDLQNVDFYYPKKDVLKASDGKWFIQRSIRIDDIRIDNELAESTDPLALEKFIGIKITGQTTGTVALVERVDRFYEEASLIKELIVSNIDGKFKNSEVVKGIFSDGENFREISGVVFNFVIDELKIEQQGTFYNVGDPVIIQSNTGNGACVTVGSVSGGEITEIIVIDGGSGYQVGDNLKFIGETFGGALPARANILSISDDNKVHPNTYIIDDTQISIVANDIIGNTSTISYEYETYSYQNLAIQYQTTPPTVSNLNITTSNITTISYFTNRLFRANVRIANNGPFIITSITANSSNLNVSNTDAANGRLIITDWTSNSNISITNGTSLSINNQTVVVSNVTPTANFIYITPSLSGNLTSNTIVVLYSKRQQSLISTYNTVNDYITVYPGFVDNISGYPIETISIRNWTNLYVNTGPSNTNTINLLQISFEANTSNLKIQRIDSANTLVLTGWKANSNVYFATGYSLNVNNTTVLVTSSSPERDWIRTSPAITGNIANASNVIVVYEPKYIKANVENSNVFFTTSNILTISGINVIVTNASSNSNVISFFPEIESNLNLAPIRIFTNETNVANIKITNAYADTIKLNEFAANSNIFFRAGDYLNVNGSLYLVNSYDLRQNTIVFYPGLRESNAKFSHFVVNRVPFNASSNLTVNTGLTSTNTINLGSLIDTNISNLKIGNTAFNIFFDDARPQIFLTDLIGRSNVLLSNGSVISINNQTVYVTGSNGASQNVLYVSSPITSNLWNNNIIILTYTNAFKSNSNVFFETGDSLNVNGTIVRVTSSNTITQSLNVTPALPGGLLQVPFDVIKKPNVNTVIANSLIYFTYAPTGPVTSVRLISGGGYLRTPDIQVEANSKIYQYGILGSMKIVNPGTGYSIGDLITFTNVVGGTGTGGLAEVYNVNVSGSITEVRFKDDPNQPTGGRGYDINFLPTANIISATGTNGQIAVKDILGSGAKFQAKSNKVGGIKSLIIRSRGAGYEDAYADLTANGDGNAVVSVSVVSGDIFGVYAYPGRWLGDDGQLSAPNYLQDRDYYQTFSYVIKTDESISKYRKVIKDLVHPSGTKLFGEHMIIDMPSNTACPCNVETTLKMTSTIKTYEKTGNTINISYESHSLETGNTVYLEFTSGGNTNVKNGIYSVLTTLPNYFTVRQYSPIQSITIVNPGRYYNSNSYLVIVGDGKNANATFTKNASGSIVSVTIRDNGTLYTQAPTVTANGSNGIMATFSATIKYANNTNGNVIVSIVK